MAVGSTKQVDEMAQNMGAERLAFVAAGHDRSVEADAEMVRPEPDEPLDKPDFGVTRGIDPRLGLGQNNLLRQPHRPRLIGPRLFIRRTFRFRLRVAWNKAATGELRLRGACGVELEDRAKRGGAAQQAGIDDLPSVCSVEIGGNRPLRICSDRRNRSGARAKPEAMQCQSCFVRIPRHRSRLSE